MPEIPPIHFLDHIAIGVPDLDAAADWYAEMLGLEVVQNPAWGPFPVMVMAGRSGLALFPAQEGELDAAKLHRHIAFRVAIGDLKHWHHRLVKQGLEVREEYHDPYRSLFFRDLNGYEIELMAREKTVEGFRRTLVVGDIHGAMKALEQALDRAGFDLKQDRLISLGDVVDGWPESPEVVEFLLGLPHLVAIQGNHDEFFLTYLNYGEADVHWLEGEGKSTLQAYNHLGLLEDPRHRGFFYGQLPYFIDDQHRCFVHGGYDPRRPIQMQPASRLCWNRSLWSQLTDVRAEPDRPEDVNGFTEVFIGHTPTVQQWPELKPVRLGNVWNLDQGAKVKGKLTVMDVDTHEFWQSDRVKELYPKVDRRWKRFQSK